MWRQHCVLRCCPSVAKRGNIVAQRTDTRNVTEDFQKYFCVQDTTFVSATNVARVAKQGNICGKHDHVSNVAATQCVLVSLTP